MLDPFAASLKPLVFSPQERRVGEAIKARFAASNLRLSNAYFEGSLFATENQFASELRNQ